MNEELSIPGSGREAYPRVSEIISPWSKQAYDSIPIEVLMKAAERGTRVHAHCTAMMRGDFMIWESPEIHCYVSSFEKWWDSLNEPELFLTEKRLYDDELRFSGQADLIYREKDGPCILVDIKTTKKVSPIWGVQLAAYAHLAQLNGYDVQGCAVIHVKCRSVKSKHAEGSRIYLPSKCKLHSYPMDEIESHWGKYFRPALDWYYFCQDHSSK